MPRVSKSVVLSCLACPIRMSVSLSLSFPVLFVVLLLCCLCWWRLHNWPLLCACFRGHFVFPVSIYSPSNDVFIQPCVHADVRFMCPLHIWPDCQPLASEKIDLNYISMHVCILFDMRRPSSERGQINFYACLPFPYHVSSVNKFFRFVTVLIIICPVVWHYRRRIQIAQL